MVYAEQNFTPNSPSAGWDGMFGGQNAPEGVYVYTIEYTLINGDIVRSSGDVTLIR